MLQYVGESKQTARFTQNLANFLYEEIAVITETGDLLNMFKIALFVAILLGVFSIAIPAEGEV